MDTAIEIWNALWDRQIEIVVMFVLIIWLIVRGGDLFRWVYRKLTGRNRRSAAPLAAPHQNESPEAGLSDE